MLKAFLNKTIRMDRCELQESEFDKDGIGHSIHLAFLQADQPIRVESFSIYDDKDCIMFRKLEVPITMYAVDSISVMATLSVTKDGKCWEITF